MLGVNTVYYWNKKSPDVLNLDLVVNSITNGECEFELVIESSSTEDLTMLTLT